MSRNTKEKILEVLDANRGNFVSGEKIAKDLNLSRGAIWKTIKTLQEEGYIIDAVTHKGYSLASKTDLLSHLGISSRLRGEAKKLDVEIFSELPSTNFALKERIVQGEDRDLVFIAESQTKGRGRRGRTFYSPSGSGLYMSILFHPEISIQDVTLLTAVTAVVTAQVVEDFSGRETCIKWVNDIFQKGKKVAGILTEGAISLESGEIDYVIVGIGINIFTPDNGFPPEIKQSAGSLFPSEMKEKIGGIRTELAAELLNRLMNSFHTLKDDDSRQFLLDYRKRSMVIGKNIWVLKDGKKIAAQALAIDDNCHLLVKYENGIDDVCIDGEISLQLSEFFKREDM